MTPVNHRRSPLRWLAIPALLAVLALIGLALSTESRGEFEERTSRSTGEDQSGQQDPDNSSSSQQADEQPGSQTEEDRSGDESGRETQSSGEGSGDGRPIVIQTPDGDVVIELGDGDTVRAVPGDSPLPSDPSRTLTPSDDGSLGGLRVTEDGRIEAIEVPEVPDRDFQLEPSPDGIIVTRPDGTVIEVRPGETEVSATEQPAGDQPNPLTAENGDITVQSIDEFPADQQTSPTAQPLIVETPEGPVRFELDGDGDLVVNQPDPASVVEVNPDDLVAIRVDEDGNLEVVPLDEIGPDDTVLVPADGGVDLVRPDGSRVEFRVDGENDGVTATEITTDGREVELEPNPDGSVTLEDGTTVGPIDFAEDGGAIERLLDQTADLPWPWVFGAIALLVLLSAGTALYLYKTRPDGAFDFSQLAATGVDVDEFEDFLTVLSTDEDPARAIRLAFYAVERGLAGLPPRRQDETPFEWHHRVQQERPDLAEPLASICDRFAMVRFAPGQTTTADRDMVVARLRQLHLLGGAASRQATDTMAGV